MLSEEWNYHSSRITEKGVHNASCISGLQDLIGFWQRESTIGGARAVQQRALRAACATSLGAVGSKLEGSDIPRGLNTEQSV